MVRRFGGGLRELSLERAKEYWGDVEKLPTLVKSMHQKKPMQVKYGSSNNAKTYKIEPKEVAKYHLAWVNYAPTSGKYKNATYSQDHLCLHTYLQRNPQVVLQSPELHSDGSWWPVVLIQRQEDADYEDLSGLDFARLANPVILIICWCQIMEDGFWVWVMSIQEVKD